MIRNVSYILLVVVGLICAVSVELQYSDSVLIKINCGNQVNKLQQSVFSLPLLRHWGLCGAVVRVIKLTCTDDVTTYSRDSNIAITHYVIHVI